ncbi:hypothetical protein [Sandarakinorhabdus sp.]|uniref:hypothetical protein n=1 Tax=Sandarakinorhabdus sp. TaxID=1916663 RepID=UPI00286E630E|nr:hypothetical protein [Sandarakinorhabdus sp.]
MIVATAAAAVAPTGKPAAAPAAAPASPLTGTWAGDGFALRPAATGYVVQGKCAAGKITGTVVPDGAGAFIATGYFNPRAPVRRAQTTVSGEQLPVIEALSQTAPRDEPAQFKGKIRGNSLTLVVRVTGKPGEARHVLKRGAAIRFPDCK